MTTSGTKASVREQVRASRRAGPPADAHRLAERARELVDSLPGPARVTCYASYGTEPDTSVLRSSLAADGFAVLLPRVAGDDLEWVLDRGEHAMSSMGIAEPNGPAVALLPARVLLIPALAVTRDGGRLGKGGGFYDRALAALGPERPPAAALVRDEDVLVDVPMDPHDVRIDIIVTPSSIIRCG